MKLAKEAMETEERMEQRRGNVLLQGIKSYLRASASVGDGRLVCKGGLELLEIKR